jgi:UDP-N-acetylmuramoyl-tripeptide--D-alanyl-D-alanine ligase (fragment)
LTIIDDTYNASPVSMNGAVDILEDIVPAVGGRKIAVLADMKELGEDAEKMHYECGEYLGKKNIHILVHLGELSKEIERGFLHIQPKGEVYGFLDREKMDQFLRNFIRSKDVLLFKGSNSMHLSKSIEELLQNELICRCDH